MRNVQEDPVGRAVLISVVSKEIKIEIGGKDRNKTRKVTTEDFYFGVFVFEPGLFVDYELHILWF